MNTLFRLSLSYRHILCPLLYSRARLCPASLANTCTFFVVPFIPVSQASLVLSVHVISLALAVCRLQKIAKCKRKYRRVSCLMLRFASFNLQSPSPASP